MDLWIQQKKRASPCRRRDSLCCACGAFLWQRKCGRNEETLNSGSRSILRTRRCLHLVESPSSRRMELSPVVLTTDTPLVGEELLSLLYGEGHFSPGRLKALSSVTLAARQRDDWHGKGEELQGLLPSSFPLPFLEFPCIWLPACQCSPAPEPGCGPPLTPSLPSQFLFTAAAGDSACWCPKLSLQK